MATFQKPCHLPRYFKNPTCTYHITIVYNTRYVQIMISEIQMLALINGLPFCDPFIFVPPIVITFQINKERMYIVPICVILN